MGCMPIARMDQRLLVRIQGYIMAELSAAADRFHKHCLGMRHELALTMLKGFVPGPLGGFG